jgi:hypothetical protein
VVDHDFAPNVVVKNENPKRFVIPDGAADPELMPLADAMC